MIKKLKNNLSSKDHFLISFIALSFTLFTLPIIQNLDLSFLKITPAFVLIEALVFLFLANLALWIASIISQKIPVILQIAKFVAVGAFNTFLNWGIVNLLMFATQIFDGEEYTYFIVIAFTVANVASFFWNKHWVFPKKQAIDNEKSGKDFVQFVTVSIIGLGIQAGIASGWVNLIETEVAAGVWANLGLLMGTLFSMVWNFLGYKFIVFKK